MIMGGVYLTYSAYFLSLDFITIFIIMNCVMVPVYGALAYVYSKNCWENMKSCKVYLDEMAEGEPMLMQDSLKLKYFMLKWICIGSVGFCITKILLYGVIRNLWDDFITYKLELTL